MQNRFYLYVITLIYVGTPAFAQKDAESDDSAVAESQAKLGEAYSNYYTELSHAREEPSEDTKRALEKKHLTKAREEVSQTVEKAVASVMKKYNLKQVDEKDPAIRELLAAPDPLLNSNYGEQDEFADSPGPAPQSQTGGKSVPSKSRSRSSDSDSSVEALDYPSELRYEVGGDNGPSGEFFGVSAADRRPAAISPQKRH